MEEQKRSESLLEASDSVNDTCSLNKSSFDVDEVTDKHQDSPSFTGHHSKDTTSMSLRHGFGAIGRTVGSHPCLALIFSISICISSSVLLFAMNKPANLAFEEGYVAPGAPSIAELNAQVEFFGNLGKPWYMGLFAEPRKETGSMIESSEFAEFKKFYRDIKTKIVLRETKDANATTNYTYMDYCGPMCTFNDVLFKTYDFSFFGINWPVTGLFMYESNIGKYFFLREMSGNTIKSSKLAALYFMVFVNSTEVEEEMKGFEDKVADLVAAHNANDSKLTTLTQHSALGMETEIAKGMETVALYLMAGLVCCLVCCLFSFCLSLKVYEVYSACSWRVFLLFIPTFFLPFMTLVTAASGHIALGNHFNTIMLFCPFFTFAFVFDGVFIVYNSWLCAIKKRIYTDNSEQMQEVFAECIPSVIVCSLTAVVLLFTKYFPIEEYAQVAFLSGLIIIAGLFFQLFFFAPLLAICMPIRPFEKLHRDGKSRPISQGVTELEKRALKPYANCLGGSIVVKGLAILLFVFAIVTPAVFGMRKVEGNLDYRHLLLPESPKSKGVHIMSDVIWPDFLHILFFVENPPRFDDPKEYQQFEKMIADIQALPGTMEPGYNMMWLRDFKTFSGTKPDADRLDMTKFVHFITDDIYKAWTSGVKYRLENDTSTGESNAIITNMVYMVAFNGTRTLADKAKLLTHCREVADRYPQFQAIPFDTEVGMVDVILQAPSITIILPAAILLLLVFSFLLFASNLSSSIIVAICGAAVYYSALGMAGFTGLTINPFVVSYLLLAAALTPKVVVHIAYHFQLSAAMQKKDPEARLIDSLGKVFLPVVQSTFCTFVIFLPMLFVPVTIFYNIAVLNLIFFVVSLIVAFLFLPTVLSSLPKELTGRGCLYTVNH